MKKIHTLSLIGLMTLSACGMKQEKGVRVDEDMRAVCDGSYIKQYNKTSKSLLKLSDLGDDYNAEPTVDNYEAVKKQAGVAVTDCNVLETFTTNKCWAVVDGKEKEVSTAQHLKACKSARELLKSLD